MSTIALKQFDTARAIEQTLAIDGTPINLTGCEVRINWYNLLSGAMWQRDAEIVDEDAGTVTYTPVAEDVETAGDFEIEWEILYPDNSRLTVPTEGRVPTTINPAIVPA